MNTVYIYELVDPITDIPRYVGKTNNVQKRLDSHLKESEEHVKKTHKEAWISSLLKLNLKPVIIIIDEVLESEWQFWETWYISLYKSWEFDLTNDPSCPGGEGNKCWQKQHTQATKDKIGLAHKGKTFTQDHKDKLSVLKMGNSNAKGQKGAIRIKDRVYQIDFSKRVISIWNSVSEANDKFLSKGTSETSILHSICRSKGRETLKGYFWIYESNLTNNYNIGDLVLELDLKTKNREVVAYKNNKIVDYFKSLHAAAIHFKVSDTTIENYLKSQKLLSGCLLKEKQLVKEKKKLSYREILYTREELLTFSEEKLNSVVVEFYSLVKNTGFPYHETKENLENIVKSIQKFDFSRIYNEDTKTFKNQTSSAGVSYLKSIFQNYYECKYKKGSSPIDIWNDEKKLKEVIKYRVGLNKSRETFNLCLHQIIRGISARRSSISFFKPIVAACIYKFLLQDKIKPVVIDPCAGFGGRLLGFKSIYPEGTYIGLEPSKQTYNNLVKLSESFSKVKLFNCKLEDYTGSKECDLTFTSIPYYDLEEYNNDFKYESFEEWRRLFIKNLLTYKNLLVNLPIDLQKQLNLEYKEEYYLENLTSHFNQTEKTKNELILRM